MNERTPWLAGHKCNPRAKVRLFCFPYGGGGDSTFRAWQRGLPEAIEVCPVQLPGRGARIKESPFTELGPLVRAASQALAPHLDKPFALFGHSMGALVSFEFARNLRRSGGPQPVRLFVSGRCSPQTTVAPFAGDLSDSAFSEVLRRSGGTPEEVLENPELMELMLPVIRADFAACRSYVYVPEPAFNFPITAFGGHEDRGVGRDCIEGWREHTTGPFVLRMFPGDHFFLNTSTRPLLEAIAKELERDVKRIGD